jgi:class 3 adenylate cyclase/predicted ATPase
MQCANCHSDNRTGAKFCNGCGSPLQRQCAKCGFANAPQAKFCGECGAPLSSASQPPVPSVKLQVLSSQSPTPNPQPPAAYTPAHLADRIRAVSLTEGERKTITALFADLKGSTALIEGLDPEEARAIIDPALQLMMDAVHRYEGYVAQALGDGIFALFGAPLAHEDHPQRALFAALRMQEEMRRYGDQVRLKYGVPLAMRVGVNTGEVVVRSIRKDDLHTDYVPVGHSTNLAARMEQMATPGSILITEHTRRLVEGYFELKALGTATIKGVEVPLNVYEVVGTGSLRTRLQVAATRRGLTRFVGRHTEMEQLQRALEQAKAGHGQIVGVMGEPGLGKSRLFYEFKLLSQASCLVLEAYSVPHGKASPYLPVIELLKSYFRIEPRDDERTRREKVTGKVLTLDRSLEDTLPYLFALLGIADPSGSLQQMDPQIRRRRTFEALKRLFLRESLNQPLILIFEDLHWIDGETQGLLDVFSESVASARILLLTNYRPEYRHEWGQKTYYTQLRLAPFGRVEAEEFLDVLLGNTVGADPRVGPQEGAHRGAPLQSLKRLILDKTEGTPFFMEEIVQELMEQGILVRADGGMGLHPALAAQPLTDLHIPTTVHGILASRLDRLAPEEKALLQHLAVIGREFPLSLVRQVVTQPEEELYRLLVSLQRKEFLYEQPALPEPEYLFKHALTQEVAYNSVLIERRKVLHEQTGQAIERLYADRLAEHYSDLAHHYSRSSNAQKAVEYLSLAGQQALQRSAYMEAVTHLTKGLEVLKALLDTPERIQQELTLQLALRDALVVVNGYTAPEVEKTVLRARELCQQIGETPQLFPVLFRLWIFYINRGELQTARELAEQLMRLARSVQDQYLLSMAHMALGCTLHWLGEVVSARTLLEQAIELYDPQTHPRPTVNTADPRVDCLFYVAWTLWLLGYPDQALERSHEALALAERLSHPFSLAYALGIAARFHSIRREEQAARERAEAVIALSTAQGFPYWLAVGTMVRGGALVEQGQEEEGIAQMEQGLMAMRAMGTETAWLGHLPKMAEVYGRGGRTEEALAVLAEAVASVDKTQAWLYGSELYRLKGELVLQSAVRSPQSKQVSDKSQASQDRSEIPSTQHPTPSTPAEAEAEACFHKAIEVARRQSAKSLELRAVMSLSRLWQQQGKKGEALQMLAEIYNWFTEGFETKDLQEARVLLYELNQTT